MDKRILMIGGAIAAVLLIVIVMPKGGGKSPDAGTTSPNVKEMHRQAQQNVKSNDLVKAKQIYREIITEHPDTDNMSGIQKELESLNLDIIFSNVMVPDKTVMYEVAAGDSLHKIAKKYGTTVELIQRSNNLRGDVIHVGQKLRIWTGKFNIFVDKSQNILILKDGNEAVKVYTVSTGQNNSTPVGTFKIISKLIDPVWFNRGVVVPPESPQNALGSRWLGFDLPGYGIHGTIEPETIGQQVTAGCVRMVNTDVEELYSIVPYGTEVVIVD